MFQPYKQNDENEAAFIKIPLEFFLDDFYRESLNSDAKLLYALLLNRMELSRKKGWVNEEGDLWQRFSRNNLQQRLNISDKTVARAMQKLAALDLVREKKNGLGKTNTIVVGKTRQESGQFCIKRGSRNRTERGLAEGNDTAAEPESIRPGKPETKENDGDRIDKIIKDVGGYLGPVLGEFVKYRKTMGKPMRAYMLERLLDKLQSFSESEKIACLLQSMERGWMWVFPENLYQTKPMR